jgi:hypothetical protein
MRSIASSCELRLYSVSKRINEGEPDTFARKHGLKGYFHSSGGPPFYKELAHDIFYIFFARPGGANEDELWNVFAEQGRGVRLKFVVNPIAAELRPIQSEQPGTTLLNELNQALESAGEPPFIPRTLSRTGAFYLPCIFRREDELRLMLKRHANGATMRRMMVLSITGRSLSVKRMTFVTSIFSKLSAARTQIGTKLRPGS